MSENVPAILSQLARRLRQESLRHCTDPTVPPRWWYALAATAAGALDVPPDPTERKLLIAALCRSCDPLDPRDGRRHQADWWPLLYYWAKSYQLLFDLLPVVSWSKWDQQLRALAERLEGPLARIRATEPLAGDPVQLIWGALGIYQVGVALDRQLWTELAEGVCWQLIGRDWPDEHLPLWIHAVDRYAVLRRQGELRDRAEQVYPRPADSPWALLLAWRKGGPTALRTASPLTEPAPLTEAAVTALEFYRQAPGQTTMHPSMDGQPQ